MGRLGIITVPRRDAVAIVDISQWVPELITAGIDSEESED